MYAIVHCACCTIMLKEKTSLERNGNYALMNCWQVLEKLLLDSEKMTSDGGITHGSKKAIRNNKLYASQIYDGVNYLMAAKSNQVFA